MKGIKKKMTVSAVVPAYNAAKTIRACIESLRNQSIPAKEIIIVNDASTDGTRDIIGQFDVLAIDRKRNEGAAVARAEGAGKATGDIIAFLDADCIAAPGWFEQIVEEFTSDRDLGAVGGSYRYEVPATLPGLLTKLEREYAYRIYSGDPLHANPPGGNTAILKKVWNECRSGHELLYFHGMASGEDTSLCNELRKYTKVKFNPELQVTHEETTTIRSYLRRHINRGKSRTIIILNGLSSWSDPTIKGNGGLPLVIASAALFTAAISAALLFFYPLPAGSSLVVSFAIHAALYRDFSRHVRLANLPPSQNGRISAGARLIMRLLVSARSACWMVGAVRAVGHSVRSRSVRSWNIVTSMIHFWQPGRISRLFYFVTSRCNAGCDFCFNRENVANWEKRLLSELTLPEIEKIASHFGRLPYITFSGGEPFLNKDLPRIVETFCKVSKTQWVTIPTNASLPGKVQQMTLEILRRCPGVFLTIQVSLDSLFDEHDASRKIQGGFSSLAKTLAWLARIRTYAKNVRVQIATCYDDFNVHRMNEIVEYCRNTFNYDQQVFYLLREGKTAITVSRNHLIPGLRKLLLEQEGQEGRRWGRTLWNRAVTVLQRMTYDDVFHIKLTQEHLHRCYATKKFITLYEDGECAPCEILGHRTLGNIKNFGYDMHQLIKQAGRVPNRAPFLIDPECNCDWGCAISMNMLYDPGTIIKAVKKL